MDTRQATGRRLRTRRLTNDPATLQDSPTGRLLRTRSTWPSCTKCSRGRSSCPPWLGLGLGLGWGQGRGRSSCPPWLGLGTSSGSGSGSGLGLGSGPGSGLVSGLGLGRGRRTRLEGPRALPDELGLRELSLLLKLLLARERLGLVRVRVGVRLKVGCTLLFCWSSALSPRLGCGLNPGLGLALVETNVAPACPWSRPRVTLSIYAPQRNVPLSVMLPRGCVQHHRPAPSLGQPGPAWASR
eukprot:scaffold31258_cov58-Phaeocystis_antarctica.AAC.6